MSEPSVPPEAPLPTDAHLRSQLSAYPFSWWFFQLLYGPNGYYSKAHVDFSTDESVGDFMTFGSKGESLAILIVNRIFDVFQKEYLDQNATGDFLCYELSGGTGILSANVLRMIRQMALHCDDPELKVKWALLWEKIKIHTYDISEDLSKAQTATVQKMGEKLEDPDFATKFTAVNKPAQEIDTSKTVYLCYSNELFDALPSDILYMDEQGRPCLCYCVPLVKTAAEAVESEDEGSAPRAQPVAHWDTRTLLELCIL